MKNRLFKSLLVCCLVFILLFTGCVSRNTYNNLLDELKISNIKITSLESQIASKNNELSNTIINLEQTKTELSKVKTSLEQTKSQLIVTDIELKQVSDQLETNLNKISQMETGYTNLRNNINTRLGLTKSDEQSFITPNDSAVSAKVLEITGGSTGDTNKRWSDYYKMYDWIVKNIDYSYDSYTPILPEDMTDVVTWKHDFWRTPAETLKDETGDCEDMALLLFSMMENYNQQKYAVWLIRIATGAPDYKGHIAVCFPVTGDELAILDPAGKYYSGMENRYLYSNAISIAVNSWLSYWSDDMPGAFVNQVFSENVYKEFSHTDEFITWAEEQY